MKKNFAETLKEMRIRAGYSQKEVYEMFDIRQSTFSAWETGRAEPSADMLLKLCELYNINDILGAFGFNGYNDDGSIQLNMKEIDIIEQYRSLDDTGKSHIDYELNREVKRLEELQKKGRIIEELQKEKVPTRLFAYYGKIAAAGKSFGFEDVIAGTIERPVTEVNENADYTIGVSGDSMEPTYYDGDIVYVKKTTSLKLGDVGIFQKDNGIYIKEVGENALISHNSNYDPMVNGGDVICLGKVLGKIED